MRLNQFVAQATGLSRRAADKAIAEGRVQLNKAPARLGMQIQPTDIVQLDGEVLKQPDRTFTIMLNKPSGYVCSRQGQGSKTIYELLPRKYHILKPVGRLDKDSSGLLLLTNNGQLAHELTHPKNAKTKVYEVTLNKPLHKDAQQAVTAGVKLQDGLSKLSLRPLGQNGLQWQVSMTEGRNRQIRRTFAALGYSIIKLHRTQFGPYKIGNLLEANWQLMNDG